MPNRVEDVRLRIERFDLMVFSSLPFTFDSSSLREASLGCRENVDGTEEVLEVGVRS